MAILWETRNLSVIVEDLKRGARDFSQKRGNKIAQIALDEAEQIASEELRHRPDRARKGGKSYFAGFRFQSARNGGGDTIEFSIGNDAPHAKIIELGSRPHSIPLAPVGHRLSWPAWRAYTYGKRRLVKPGEVVDHPGTRPYNILRRAMNSAVQQQRRVGNRR
jgi:hypothetical protein